MKNVLTIASVLLICILFSGCKNITANEPSTSAGVSEKTITEVTTEVTTDNSATEKQTEWSPSSLKEGLTTTIEYDKKYNAVVASKEDAWKVIRMYGDRQKATYNNPKISAIETKMEEEFDIAYVTLGEIDEETAKDIYRAFKYMYDTYPKLKGTLTDFTLGNFSWNAMAQTRTFEFVTNNYDAPIVLKREIVVSATDFLNRSILLEACTRNEETGFWPKNASVSMIIVHELGHHLLDVHNATLHGFSGNYVTKENLDAYRDYAGENLSWNQAEIKRIIEEAYKEWSKTNAGSEEDFRRSISGYAVGTQSDGGVSYTETFAEAVADIFANGDNAAMASKLIVKECR